MTDHITEALKFYDEMMERTGMTKCERCSSPGWSVWHNTPNEKCPKERQHG